jgi:hypothetical protein
VAWSGSGLHGSWFAEAMYDSTAADPSDNSLAHPLDVAVYDGNVTPVRTAGQVAGYGLGCWAIGEVSDPPGWPAGGVPVPGFGWATAADQTVFTAGDVAAGPCTLFPSGDMIYDTAATSHFPLLAWCFHDYGGTVPVQAGTLTIAWGPAGVAVLGSPLTAAVVP